MLLVVILHITTQAMLNSLWRQGGVVGCVLVYLYHIKRYWHGWGPGDWDSATTLMVPGGYVRATMVFSTHIAWRWRLTYISEDKKSSRPRYIRVAAIVIVINQGMWKICVSVSQKTTSSPSRSKQKHTTLSESGIGRRFDSINISRSRQQRTNPTI